MVDLEDIDRFLDEQALMAIRPKPGSPWRITGKFRFSAEYGSLEVIQDDYELEIILSPDFPREPPLVRETGGKVPKEADFHVNERSDSLCLGSPLAIAIRLKQKPSLTGFAETCLVPYLYGMSYRLKHGEFPFGELAHGLPGEWDDYGRLLGLKSREQILAAFALLGMKKRIANKRPCPCGCGNRLGRCPTNNNIRPLRNEVGRRWFRNYLVEYAEFQKIFKEAVAKAPKAEKPPA